jgi:anti-sigma factor RsiW
MNAIKAKEPGACCSRSVMLLADGELEPSRSIEVGAHVKACEACRCQLELIRAMRTSLRRSCAHRAPSGMEERLRARLASCGDVGATVASGDDVAVSGSSVDGMISRPVVDARLAQPFTREMGPDSIRGRRWAMAGAFAVAACFVVVIVMRSNTDRSLLQSAVAGHAPASIANDNRTNFDALIEELVSQHANPLPPEERNPEELTRLEPYVGVPVKRPALTLLRSPAVPSASFDGARLHRMREHRNAAVLQYKFKGHRLTVYVFDSRTIPMSRTRLRSRPVERRLDAGSSVASGHVAAAPVYVGNFRGFSVGATERAGVGYAWASDFDEEKNVQLVAASF